ncbi:MULTISPECIES: maltokinase N-terminal cap-like domain-containing protein [Streptomyces]|uniref:maltokinase N-terminal cap-like domain-containing protein n=1 Tax=Streptomyces arenae TaxID=29301 RepID=UPI001056C544|nr:1,4-alpha-glucan branching protein [Streptomyces arenae]MCG7203896.1 1,4-alpha-glucan branching protein [Streptomyces arenae]
MALIHRTTLKPTKVELLAGWLPTRPWYRGSAAPELVKAGGFRLDDPAGEVGIEFMVVTEESGAYLVPLTYRAAPLEGADHALVGTMEHGVLGTRWTYDGCHDPVLTAGLLALIEGRAQAQAQSLTDTPDHEVARGYEGEGPLPGLGAPVDTDESTEFAVPDTGLVLELRRVLTPGSTPPEDAVGHVTGVWEHSANTRTRALFAGLRPR